MFGPHLMMEAYGCDTDRLVDLSLLTDLLDELPAKMGMNKIMPPYGFKYKDGQVPEDWGLSGIVLIAESHIAIHTFPAKGFITVDIFSCKHFDVSTAVNMIVDAFQPKSWDEQLLMRGREFPRSLSKAGIIIEAERKQHFSQLMAA
jgi:S-adenosylmethionine decarboxylase